MYEALPADTGRQRRRGATRTVHCAKQPHAAPSLPPAGVAPGEGVRLSHGR
jgi:hypothetical protein